MKKLRLKNIRIDGGTQMRVGPRNQEAVREYADVLGEGGTLPPVTVFFDGKDYWLADGFHRYSAHMLLNWLEIDADIREGSQRDAILYAIGANTSHGLRRTNQDKRRAVETLLKDQEWGQWNDAEIARRAHVSAMTVGRARQELISNNVIDSPTQRTVQRGGTIYAQNTANIGARPATPAPDPVQEIIPPLAAQIAEPGERVTKAEDLYIPFQDDNEPRLAAAEIEKGVKDIHTALDRLLRHERIGRGLLATPDPYTRSVRSLAWHAREMLDEWLDEPTERDSKTITIDALN